MLNRDIAIKGTYNRFFQFMNYNDLSNLLTPQTNTERNLGFIFDLLPETLLMATLGLPSSSFKKQKLLPIHLQECACAHNFL